MFKFFRAVFYAIVALVVIWAVIATAGWFGAALFGAEAFTFASFWSTVSSVLVEKTILSVVLGGSWSVTLLNLAGAMVAVTIGSHFSHSLRQKMVSAQTRLQNELVEIHDKRIAELIGEEAEDQATAEAMHTEPAR